MTTKVSTTEYRSRMRYWHEVAQRGEDLVVTDHDRPVVRVSAAGSAATLDRLEREGLLRRGGQRLPSGELIAVPARGDSAPDISADRDR
jgi:antitoxin (DNA-binding transcriptional repressor) of toxin-antitoxin stability system